MYKAGIHKVFFFIFFVVGILIYKDFGISVDEKIQRRTGLINAFEANKRLGYIFMPKSEVEKYPLVELAVWKDNIYGPVFEIFLVAAEFVSGVKDPQSVFHIRHLLTFIIFFISVYVFYLIIKKQFKDEYLALIGILMLILTPRIFAHSFYNSKDLVFLSFYIFTIKTGIDLLQKQSIKNLVLHSLFTALLIAIRITGLFIPIATVIIFSISIINRYSHARLRNYFAMIIGYVTIAYLLTVVFWPYLWFDPFNNFVNAFIAMQKYNWSTWVLFDGEIINSFDIPWNYALVWMSITIPILYLILFMIGLFFVIRMLWISFKIKSITSYNLNILYYALLFFGPLLAVIILKSTLYNDWRHLYFIYPPFLLISIYGYKHLTALKILKNHRKLIYISISLYLAFVTVRMIQIHPFEMNYFNELGLLNKGKYDLDFWGSSYKQGLEKILEIEASADSIRIADLHNENKLEDLVTEIYLRNNLLILDKQKRQKFKTCSIDDADYVLTNYFETKYDEELFRKKYSLPIENEIYSIYVDQNKILSIYKL